MLTTTDDDDFMAVLDPGDLLVFSGYSPADRLLQWVDGSSYNHVGIWLGTVQDEHDPNRIELNQTIHAGLSSRTLTDEEKATLFGDDSGQKPHARRHGTVWMVPLDTLLDVSAETEVGGGVRFESVTALRWNSVETTFDPVGNPVLSERPYNVDAIREWATKFLKKKETDEAGDEQEIPPVLFDFDQLVSLACFWIDRAYRDMGKNGLLAQVTIDMFESLRPELEKQRDVLTANYPANAEVTTCSRFVHDALTNGGHAVTIPVPPVLADHFPPGHDNHETRIWVSPSDYLKSPDFRAIAHWVRSPEPPTTFG